MDCIRIREQLGLYVDGELPEEAGRQVTEHLRTCPTCSSEVRSLQELGAALTPREAPPVPDALWHSIEDRLDNVPRESSSRHETTSRLRVFRRPLAAAASLLFLIGLGAAAFTWLPDTASTAHASSVDFRVLLDRVSIDARGAFRAFLARYEAVEIPASEAHNEAPHLDFEVPEVLPGSFRRTTVYLLRFGNAPGIAAEYTGQDGEFLAALFHRPVLREEFGTHKDYPCVIGQHRGHSVEVGSWRLVHLMDPSTCHCLLSKLDHKRGIAEVMSAIAPRSMPSHSQPPDGD